ncbi:MAG: hypothetical protein GY869_27210, partial [Planctomycetes bacterium]|nr:hypothetical protein [Planctomycetota bacterium]
SDGKLITRQNLHLVVSATPIEPDVIIELTPSFPATVGQSVLVHVGASGIADIELIELLIDQQPVTLDQFNRAYYTATTTGHVDIQAVVTDVDGITSVVYTDLKVRDLADTQPPLVAMSSPVEGEVINSLADITADITDINLDWYRLEIAPIGSDNFSLLADGTEQVVDTDLAMLDPNGLANGAYQIRLTAADIGGRSTMINQTVEINTASKSDSLQISTTDITTVLNGVPIEIVRNYSTLNATDSGTFGFGWSLTGFDPHITTNVPLTGWEHTGVYNAFTEQTRLYLDLPDGQRVGYTFAPDRVEFGSHVYYQPAWTADPGVDYTFNSADAALDLVDGRFYQKGTGLPYNPAAGWFDGFAYTLIDSAGIQYSYDSEQDLEQVTGAAGQVLQVSDSGIVAVNGERIGFQWNRAGQLENIVAPNGSQIIYTYSDDGNLQSVVNLNTGNSAWYAYDDNFDHYLSTVVATAADSRSMSYDTQSRLLSLDLVDDVLGAISQFAGNTTADVIAAGETDRYGIILSEAELATSLTPSMILGVEITGTGGFEPATAAIAGLTPIYTSVSSDH